MSNPNTLQGFVTHLKTVGMPLAAYYYVLLPDVNTSGNVSEPPSTISLLCDNVSIPGLSIMSTEHRIFGEVSDIAYGVTYPPASMSFLVDHNFGTRKYFEDWSQQVMNRTTRNVGYYYDYVKTVLVFATDRNGIPIFGLKLHQAWPKTISDQAMSNAGRDIVRLDVQLAYKFWERLDVDGLGNTQPKKYGSNSAARGFGLPGVSNFFPETLGNTNLIPFNVAGNLGGGTGAFALQGYGFSTGTAFAKSGKKVGALLGSSSMSAPTEPTFGNKLGGLLGSTGFNMGVFGNSIGQLGTAVNTIAGPISAASNAIGSVAGSLGAVDALLTKVGINTRLGRTVRDLSQAAGGLAVVSQLNNIPGSLTSIGSHMGATGAAIRQATESIANLPGATSSITGALNEMGSLFSTSGSTLGNIGNTQ